MEKVIERTPYDVWFNIARFIPHDVLIGLSTVNRSFLDIATSARYGVVTFSKFDKNTKWFCRNLRYVLCPRCIKLVLTYPAK